MTRAFSGFALLAHFFVQVVMGGAKTAWIIVQPGARPTPTLARLPFGDMSPTGAAIFACLVTLTPGTTTVDLDLEHRAILEHLLDGTDPADSLSGLRLKFERHLQTLFPEHRS
jgi:multisubunit Na+/H+ antiporter MnhE subunit